MHLTYAGIITHQTLEMIRLLGELHLTYAGIITFLIAVISVSLVVVAPYLCRYYYWYFIPHSRILDQP